jgi:glycosyltransferase involved in cell wall biosynthesis
MVQYAGDYRQALLRIKATGEETYYAQRYSVDAVAELVSSGYDVTVITALTESRYDEVLENGVRAIGAGFSEPFDPAALTAMVAEQKPDRLIMRTPMMHTFQWAATQPVRTIAVLADSFSASGLRGRIRSFRWASLFKRDVVEWIFNHGLNSCLSLRAIGVSAEKIVPWDWPAMVTPSENAKTLQASYAPRVTLYVGIITESKGIGDTLRSISKLKAKNVNVKLRAVGGGDVDHFKTLATTLGIEDRVEFLGLLPHDRVLEEMRTADVMIVPSRHEYAEGFPMTIYEALCSRTPIVASDHPMFRANLTHNLDAWVFPAGNADALADGVETLLSDNEIYGKLSAASAEAWERLQLPVKWADAVARWLADTPEDREWLREHRLSAGIYPLDRYA